MGNEKINWAEVYQELQIEAIKTRWKWFFFGSLGLGLIILTALLLIFKNHVLIAVFFGGGILIFSGKFGLGVWRLSKHPKVVSGIISAKIKHSHTEDSTKTTYDSFFLKVKPTTLGELMPGGLDVKQIRSYKNQKVRCTHDLFSILKEGDHLTAVVLPHDKSIGWFQKVLLPLEGE